MTTPTQSTETATPGTPRSEKSFQKALEMHGVPNSERLIVMLKESRLVERELTERDKTIIDLANQADAADMLHRKAIAKVEALRRTATEQAHALTQPAPPVIRRDTAERLAEALIGCAARLAGRPDAPSALANVKAIESSLTAYKEETR